MDTVAECDHRFQLSRFQRVFARGPLEDVPASKCGGSTKNIEKFRYVRVERKTPHLDLGHAHQMIEPGKLHQHFRNDPPREWEDVFISLNQYRGRRNADESGLSMINALAIDLDFDKSKIGCYTSDQLLEVLEDFGLPEPAFVIATGGGLHSIWLLSRRGLAARFGMRLHEPSQRFVDWFKDVGRRLQDVLAPLGADPAYPTSPTQTVRLPGSWNVEADCQVELAHADPTAVTWLRAFDEIKPVDHHGYGEARSAACPSGRKYPSKVDWAKNCKAYETAVKGVSEGKREVATFLVSIANYNRGLSHEDALSHALEINQRHSPPLPDWEVKHAVLMAYRHGYGYSRRRSCEKLGIEHKPRRRKHQRKNLKAHEIRTAVIQALHTLGIYKRDIVGLKEMARHIGLSERQLRHAIQTEGLGDGIEVTIEATAQGRAMVFRWPQGQASGEGSDNIPPESRGRGAATTSDDVWRRVPGIVLTTERSVQRGMSRSRAGPVCLDGGAECRAARGGRRRREVANRAGGQVRPPTRNSVVPKWGRGGCSDICGVILR